MIKFKSTPTLGTRLADGEVIGEDREAIVDTGADTNSVAPDEPALPAGSEDAGLEPHGSVEKRDVRPGLQTREAYLKKGEALIRSLL